MTPFIKLAQDFRVNWNVNDIVGKISDDIKDPNNNLVPYYDPSGAAHWQYYLNVNIAFTRNFYKNFPRECFEVYIKLKELQKEYLKIPTDDELMLEFINHRIVPDRVNIIRNMIDGNVQPHSDATRTVCINIGLQNSNTSKIRVSNSTVESEFYDTPTTDFIMNDGDVFLLSTKNTHSVESVADSLDPRYIITYHLK